MPMAFESTTNTEDFPRQKATELQTAWENLKTLRRFIYEIYIIQLNWQ